MGRHAISWLAHPYTRLVQVVVRMQTGSQIHHYVEQPRRKTQRVDLENFCLGWLLEPSFSPSSWPAPLQHDPVSPARRLTCGPVA